MIFKNEKKYRHFQEEIKYKDFNNVDIVSKNSRINNLKSQIKRCQTTKSSLIKYYYLIKIYLLKAHLNILDDFIANIVKMIEKRKIANGEKRNEIN